MITRKEGMVTCKRYLVIEAEWDKHENSAPETFESLLAAETYAEDESRRLARPFIIAETISRFDPTPVPERPKSKKTDLR